MKNEIIIKEKPETISWEELAKCQQYAHESNKAIGVNMQCASYSAEQLKDAVKNATTFVALNNLEKLMGMLSVDFREINRWWHKGIAAYICFVAVAPEYKGRGVYKALGNKAGEYILARGVGVEFLHTHADNKIARKVYEKDGYRCVLFSPGSGQDYYSVEMAKWIDGRGKGKLLCKLIFFVYELVVRILYKPGRKIRFFNL